MALEGLALVDPDSDEGMQDYDVQELFYGPQGGTMIRMRFRFGGQDVPACQPIIIRYEQCLDIDCLSVEPDAEAPISIALRTYEDGASRITDVFFGQLPYSLQAGDLARITITAGPEGEQVTAGALLWLDDEGAFP